MGDDTSVRTFLLCFLHHLKTDSPCHIMLEIHFLLCFLHHLKTDSPCYIMLEKHTHTHICMYELDVWIIGNDWRIISHFCT